MKTSLSKLTLGVLLTLIAWSGFAQQTTARAPAPPEMVEGARTIPSVEIQRLDKTPISTSTFSNQGKPMIICFWATWSAPGKLGLNNISDQYPDWVKETGVKLIAIAIDDPRNADKVKPYIDSKAWDFEAYLDPNQTFKQAMNVNAVPHTFVINGKGEIVWELDHFVDGDQSAIYEEVKKVAGAP